MVFNLRRLEAYVTTVPQGRRRLNRDGSSFSENNNRTLVLNDELETQPLIRQSVRKSPIH